MSTPSSSSSSSGSKNGTNGGSRKDQRKRNRESKFTKGKSAVSKKDDPEETTDQTSNDTPEEVEDGIKDKLEKSSTQDVQGSENNSEEPPRIIYDGDNWGPDTTQTAKAKILKKGHWKKEMHHLPPLQIAGIVAPSRDKIIRDREAALSQEEFNTGISEKINRGGRGEEGGIPAGMNPGVYKNEKVAWFERESTDRFDRFGEAWRKRPDVPTTEELMADAINLPTNLIDGAYESVDDYLETHYELLREDAFATLRQAVLTMKEDPNTGDTHDVSIYENVRVLGITFSNVGIATKVSFSTNRAGKKIPWKQSKRLLPGTLVCLSHDNFQTVKVATVAARPLSGLQMNPPEVDLFFNETELEIDTAKVFLMVESRNGYYEAYKWTLRALQRMTKDNFPLHEHICFLDKNIPPPNYVMQKPFLDLSAIFPDEPDKEPLEDVHIIKAWPQNAKSAMDHAQMTALHSILTKRVSIVQGPPGTGKTYVSVRALRILLQNMDAGDPPIIVACQTNHALDQLLNKILETEDEIVRMGGRTQDKGKIKDHTIYETRIRANIRIKGSQYSHAASNLKRIQEKITKLFECLKQEVLTVDDLYANRLITPSQAKSFVERSAGWIVPEETAAQGGLMGQWLGEYFKEIQVQDIIDGDDYEEGDIDEEKRKEVEEEFHSGPGENGDKIDDRLKGEWFGMGCRYTVENPVGVSMAEIQQSKRVQNVWDLEGYMRAALYHHLRQELIKKIWNEVKNLNKEYQRYCQMLKIARMEKDAHIIANSKLVGMTTTGLAKYRSVIAAVGPKIVLIEEAAEALEGPVVVACMPSVEHLILVGDHKQLRGHCSDMNLSESPYYLDISMFERLVTNELPYETLRTQRRMRPEIREILKPIYQDTLVDDQTVLGRESVRGMGDVNVYWYTHFYPEGKDDVHSRLNKDEAEMIVGFANYLVLNDLDPQEITILTFYAGQRTLILQLLKKCTNLAEENIKVKTVDSYQGEENTVILLSLVRSNDYGHIGFLDVENRVCVALSRAQKGLYIFGNATIITQASKLWWEIGSILNVAPSRLGISLSLTCQKHKIKTIIEDHLDWVDINGGCRKWCKEVLPCGHNCILRCHSFSHELIRCTSPCSKTLPCSHPCGNICSKPCSCPKCGNQPVKSRSPPPGRLSNQINAPNPQTPSPPVTAVENRAAERSLVLAGNTDRVQATPPRLVDVDPDEEWAAALPVNRVQKVVKSGDDYSGISRGVAPLEYTRGNDPRMQNDYPQKTYQDGRPGDDYSHGNYSTNNSSQNNHPLQNRTPPGRPHPGRPPPGRPPQGYPPQGRPPSSQGHPPPSRTRPPPAQNCSPPAQNRLPSPQSRPRGTNEQEGYRHGGYQDEDLRDDYQQETPSLDNRLVNRPRNSHSPNYPQNNYPQRGYIQDEVVNHQERYDEGDYNRNNYYPSRGGPATAPRGTAYRGSGHRQQARESWPEDDGGPRYMGDREGGMQPREPAYNPWGNREYSAQNRRTSEVWPPLERGPGAMGSPRGPEPVHRNNNVWHKNTQNNGQFNRGGGRGRDHPPFTAYR